MNIKVVLPMSRMYEVGSIITDIPTRLPVLLDDGNYDVRTITNWSPANPNGLDTSVAGIHSYTATVEGTGNNIGMLDIIIGRPEETNPPSVFPENIDDFGIPKQDINTADIPAIDAYEYLMAKKERHIGEDYSLKQLAELLKPKMIVAATINAIQNAIVSIQKYLKEHPFTDYYNQIDNIGRGAEIYAGDRDGNKGKIAEMRTIRGVGMADVTELATEVEILVPDLVAGDNINIEKGIDEYVISATGGGAEIGCEQHIEVGSVTVCPNDVTSYITQFTNDGISWGNFWWRMSQLKGGDANSLLMQFGVGQDASTRTGSGYMLKGQKTFMIEIKTVTEGRTVYEGIEIGNGTNGFYSQSTSKIKAAIVDQSLFGNY